MSIGRINVPLPKNEPILDYALGSTKRKEFKETLKVLSASPTEVPLVIGGREARTGDLDKVMCPHDNKRVIATFHKAGTKEIQAAIVAAKQAWPVWVKMPWEDRVAIARALALDPQALLLDEPTANVDRSGVKQLDHILKN